MAAERLIDRQERLDTPGDTRYISATVVSSNSSEGSQSLQRVRVAMTGLAAVFVFIGIASAAFNYESKEAAVTAVGAAKQDTVANMTDSALGNTIDEPLAELGIAPSAAGPDDVKASEQPKR